MKQKIILLMALIAATITFSACSSDDDDDKVSTSSLVGKWYAEDEGYGCEFQFNADGTLTYIETMLDAQTSKVRDSGTYKLDGNKLTLHWTKSETWSNYSQQWIVDDTSTETAVVRISLRGNQLPLYPNTPGDSSKPVTFTRE
uniref:hypothetical protein n=1 Tax=Prevotella sp. TaxID=59823 RepID=UPI004028F36B